MISSSNHSLNKQRHIIMAANAPATFEILPLSLLLSFEPPLDAFNSTQSVADAGLPEIIC